MMKMQMIAAVLSSYATLHSGVYPQFYKTCGKPSRDELPCKNCGKMTTHKKQYCSGDCFRAQNK